MGNSPPLLNVKIRVGTQEGAWKTSDLLIGQRKNAKTANVPCGSRKRSRGGVSTGQRSFEKGDRFPEKEKINYLFCYSEKKGLARCGQLLGGGTFRVGKKKNQIAQLLERSGVPHWTGKKKGREDSSRGTPKRKADDKSATHYKVTPTEKGNGSPTCEKPKDPGTVSPKEKPRSPGSAKKIRPG